MSHSQLLGRETDARGVERDRHYLHPGQVACFETASNIMTVLGSCVAVCLWDSERRIGGMNHFLLPGRPGEPHDSSRYGPGAVARLIEEMLAAGASIGAMQAKIFGGANMHRLGSGTLGLENVEVARHLVTDLEIDIVAEDVGGRVGRKIVFQTDDGTVWVKRLS